MEKKRYAFISYSHYDVKMAKWLHKKLESYKLPTEMHNEFEDSKYLRPIFRDQEDLNTGVLSVELRNHLETSKYLIVICSPNSSKSEWVSNEIQAFIEWGRWEYIIPLIIEGTPYSNDERECFPVSLRQYVSKYPNRELLGISTAEVGREKAFIRVVSRMLDVSFDELWKRHERERRRRIIAWGIGTPIVAGLLYYLAIPVSLEIQIMDDNHHLPMSKDAVLIVANAEYPLYSLDTTITINNIPGYYRGRDVPISFFSTYYMHIDNEIGLGLGLRNTNVLKIVRDSSFAIYSGVVVDLGGEPIEQAKIQVEDSITYTDKKGFFRLIFNVEEQSEFKMLRIEKSGKKAITRDDECPSNELKYLMYDE